MSDQRNQQRQQRVAAIASETHWRKVHRRKNPNLLFAEDLGPPGTKRHVEVVDSGVITVESVESKDQMPWIGFKGKNKRLALNSTNCKTMQTLTGTPIIERWRGPITLVVIRTRYYDQHTKQTEETDAIRIAGQRPGGRIDTDPEPTGNPDAAQGDMQHSNAEPLDRGFTAEEQAEIARREAKENA